MRCLMTLKSIGSLAMVIAIAACTSKDIITPQNANNSRIEIDYVLGHNRYKYVAIGGAQAAKISSYHNDKELESKKISVQKYQVFADQLESAIRSSPAGVIDESCRTPYYIRITIGEDVHKTSGCRSADAEGKIGRLLKEGEFLLYSETPLEN